VGQPCRRRQVSAALAAVVCSTLSGSADVSPAEGQTAAGAASDCALEFRRYRTLPGFRPVGLCVGRRPPRGAAPGVVLVTPRPHFPPRPGDQFAAMIVSNSGRLLWYLPGRDRIHDFKAVRYRGRTLLALYHRRAGGRGFYELRDRRYRVTGRIVAGRGLGTNSHELQVTRHGTAYVSDYRRQHVAGVGHVTEFVIQEVDIAGGAVLWEWHSLDHVPLSASYVARPADGSSWDYFHGNSIEPPAPGGHEVIVSARNTSALYGIDRRTGAVRWTLGGKRDQFGLARRHPGSRFCGQHDARRLANDDIILFDNGGAGPRDGVGCPVHAARVQWFRLDRSRRRVRLLRAVSSRRFSGNGRGFFPPAVGSARVMPNGNTLISWGTTGRVTELTLAGGVAYALRLQSWTYRAIRAHWRGFPAGRPALIARRRPGGPTDLWASWNGATQIRRWRVLAGQRPGAMRPVARPFPFTDLETHMTTRTRARFVGVAALNAHGRELGRSKVVRVQRAPA
jgi:hypothetical protein